MIQRPCFDVAATVNAGSQRRDIFIADEDPEETSHGRNPRAQHQRNKKNKFPKMGEKKGSSNELGKSSKPMRSSMTPFFRSKSHSREIRYASTKFVGAKLSSLLARMF